MDPNFGRQALPSELHFNAGIEQLRAVAITAVFLVHTVLLNRLLLDYKLPFSYRGLRYGVMLFFIISGYLIFKTMFYSNFDMKRFFIRRVFRLYPTIALTVVIAASIFSLHHFIFKHAAFPFREVLAEVSTAMTALYSVYLYFVPSTSELPVGLNGFTHLWSLSVEEQFYAAAALCFFASSRYLNGVNNLYVLVASLVLTALVLSGPAFGLSEDNSERTFFGYLTHSHVEYLFCGVFRGALETSGIIAGFNGRVRRMDGRLARGLICIMIVAPFLIISYAEFPAHRAMLRSGQGSIETIVLISFLAAVWLISLGFSIFPAYSLSGRIAGYIGKRSYVIYMLHPPLRLLCWIVAASLFPNIFKYPLGFGVWLFSATLVTTLFAAEMVHRYVEMPINRRGHEMTRSRAATVRQPATPDRQVFETGR